MSDPRISGHKCLFWVLKYTIHWKNSHLNRFNEKINLILHYLTPGTLKKWNLVNFLHQKGLYGLKYVGQTYFLELSKVQNTLFLYLYTSRSGAKKVEICYTKKLFFSKYLKNGVQEGLLSHTTSYTGLWMLKMGLSRKIFFWIMILG